MRGHTVEFSSKVPRPGRVTGPVQYENWRHAIAAHQWRGHGLQRILRMVEKLEALRPSVLPMHDEAQLTYGGQLFGIG